MGIIPKSIDDMEIFDIVSDLCSKPYIQTVLCCSGHYLWEDRRDYDLPYIEYYLSDKKGYDLTKKIEDTIKKRLPKEKPRVIPKVDYYDDSSLRFSGVYEGSFDVPEEQIQEAVSYFWDSFREGLSKS